jgi:hypothetical protein
MNNTYRTTLVFVLVLVVSAFLYAFQEQTIKKKDVPQPVISSFEKAYPHARAKGFSKETEEGKVIYEIESVEGTTKRDVTFDAEGNIVSVEEAINRHDLPEAVNATLQKEYPKGKLLICERVTEGNATLYEVLLKTGKEKFEIVLSPDGKITKREKK